MPAAPSEPNPDRQAIVIAGHAGDAATARAGLRSADEGVRAVALGALARLGALTATEIQRGLDDPHAMVRRRSAEELARLPPGAAPDVTLVTALGDDDASVVEVAAWAVGERADPDPQAGARLVEIVTGHPDALCREAAVAALGCLGDDDHLPAIIEALDDKATVRRRAVIALAAFDGPEVDAALERALADRDRQVRQTAEDLTAPAG